MCPSNLENKRMTIFYLLGTNGPIAYKTRPFLFSKIALLAFSRNVCSIPPAPLCLILVYVYGYAHRTKDM